MSIAAVSGGVGLGVQDFIGKGLGLAALSEPQDEESEKKKKLSPLAALLIMAAMDANMVSMDSIAQGLPKMAAAEQGSGNFDGTLEFLKSRASAMQAEAGQAGNESMPQGAAALFNTAGVAGASGAAAYAQVAAMGGGGMAGGISVSA